MTIFEIAITLFLLLDSIGNVPIFLGMLKNVDKKRHLKIIIRESLIALLVLVIFLFAGNKILVILGISPAALTIAGGVVLFLIALQMLFPKAPGTEVVDHREPFIVPMAIPLLAGSSSIAVVILLANNPISYILTVAFPGILIAWVASTLILLASTPLQRLFGERGLAAVERLMGLVLTTFAIQMLLTGISDYFDIVTG